MALPTPLVLPTPKPDHRATRPPLKDASSLRIFLWRQRMWFESTFVLSMLEPWEKVLLREFQHLGFCQIMLATISYQFQCSPSFFSLSSLVCSSIFLIISMWCVAALCITYSVRKATQGSGLGSVKGLEIVSETYWKSLDCWVRQSETSFSPDVAMIIYVNLTFREQTIEYWYGYSVLDFSNSSDIFPMFRLTFGICFCVCITLRLLLLIRTFFTLTACYR